MSTGAKVDLGQVTATCVGVEGPSILKNLHALLNIIRVSWCRIPGITSEMGYTLPKGMQKIQAEGKLPPRSVDDLTEKGGLYIF